MGIADESAEDERLREAARGMLAAVSGDRLRKVVADLGQVVAEGMTAETHARNAAAGRLTHIGSGLPDLRMLCGLPHGRDTAVIYPSDYYRQSGRPDLCPDCVREREAALTARTAESERRVATRIATKRRRGQFKKTDGAEAFVLAHPEGVTNAQVAAHIGQEERTAESTLRYVRQSRGTVERRESRWYPAKEADARKPLYRPAIVRVLTDATEPLGAVDVLACVKKVRPDATLKGVAEELHRMCELDPPLVEERGENKHGLLYCLPGGEPPTAVH